MTATISHDRRIDTFLLSSSLSNTMTKEYKRQLWITLIFSCLLLFVSAETPVFADDFGNGETIAVQHRSSPAFVDDFCITVTIGTQFANESEAAARRVGC